MEFAQGIHQGIVGASIALIAALIADVESRPSSAGFVVSNHMDLIELIRLVRRKCATVEIGESNRIKPDNDKSSRSYGTFGT